MIGLIYTDTVPTIPEERIVTQVNGVFSSIAAANINDSSVILDMSTLLGMYFFKSSFFTSNNYVKFFLANIYIVPDDNYTFSETKVGGPTEKICLVSDDNLNIVAYRSSTYQIVDVTTLLSSEIIDIGLLSVADLQTVLTVANGLTSPQIKYVSVVGNDTVTYSQIT